MNSAIVPTKVLSDPMELERTLQSGLLQSAAVAQAAAAAQVAQAAAAAQAVAAAANGYPATAGFGAGVDAVDGGVRDDQAVVLHTSQSTLPETTILQVLLAQHLFG